MGIYEILFLAIFINFLFYILSSFPVIYFLSSCISTIRTGSTILKLFYFGFCILGIGISLERTPKYTKFIFSIIPQVNIYFGIRSMCELFSRLNGNINWSNLWNGVDGQISYIQSLIMYLAEIFLYLILSFFINTYKDSVKFFSFS